MTDRTPTDILTDAADLLESTIIGNDADARHRQQLADDLRRLAAIKQGHPGAES